jgi:hypothetical protein
MVETPAARLGKAVAHVPYGGNPGSMGGAGACQGRDLSWALTHHRPLASSQVEC